MSWLEFRGVANRNVASRVEGGRRRAGGRADRHRGREAKASGADTRFGEVVPCSRLSMTWGLQPRLKHVAAPRLGKDRSTKTQIRAFGVAERRHDTAWGANPRTGSDENHESRGATACVRVACEAPGQMRQNRGWAGNVEYRKTIPWKTRHMSPLRGWELAWSAA